MDELEIKMHKRAGLAYGQDRTCGKKNDFKSEETAARVAPKLSLRFGHEMEAYPCAFCDGWHVGRTMTVEEREQFAVMEPEESDERLGESQHRNSLDYSGEPA